MIIKIRIEETRNFSFLVLRTGISLKRYDDFFKARPYANCGILKEVFFEDRIGNLRRRQSFSLYE